MSQAEDLAEDRPGRALQTQPQGTVPFLVATRGAATAFTFPRCPDPLTFVLDAAFGMVSEASTTLMIIEWSPTMAARSLHPRAHHSLAFRFEMD
jgi:hypothetical protein